MSIIDEFKYEKLMTNSYVDQISVQFLKLFKEFSTLKVTEDELDKCIALASSDYQQDHYHEQNLSNYIAPEKKLLVNPNGKTCEFAYVPIKKVAKKYLSNRSILAKVLHEKTLLESQSKRSSKSKGSKIIRSALDAQISERIYGKLKLELYIDDCETSKTNGLGSSNKLLQIYLTCADLPIEERVHSHSMEKLITVDRHKLKALEVKQKKTKASKAKLIYDPVYELFKCLRDDLTELATDGIDVSINGINQPILATLSHQCGDNLGIYEILGLGQSFNLNSFHCRFCGWQGKDQDGEESIQNHDMEPPLITNASDERAQELLSSSNRKFVFDTVPGLTPFNLASCDHLHDLPDGTLADFVSQLLTKLVEKSKDNTEKSYKLGSLKCTAVNLILSRFEKFTYHEGKPNLSWSNGAFLLKGKAMQKYEVFMKLDAILFDELDPTWQETKAYYQVKSFVMLAMAEEFSESDLARLKILAHHAVTALVSVKPIQTVTCKMHNLLHYHQLVKYFGPMIHYSTLHYERHHQVSKTIARSTMNFKNLIVTISKRHQFRKAIMEQKTDFSTRDFFKKAETVNFDRIVVSSKPDSAKRLKAKDFPCRISPFAIRKLNRNSWFHLQKFWIDSANDIWCEGRMLEIRQTRVDGRVSLVKEKELFVLGVQKIGYISYKHFNSYCHYNDYFFKQNNLELLIKMKN